MWAKKFKMPPVWAEFSVLLCAIVMRFAYYGFIYFPQLDDYIQYHNYAQFQGGLMNAIRNLGLLSARPLAGVLDVGLWSHFWNNLFVPVFIISVLFAVSALLLWRVFRRHFGTSPLFMFLLVLMPVGFEGTYWLSASSRVVVGLFFASLAAYLFDKYAEKGGVWALVTSFAAQLLAFGFYEQAIVFSITITFLLALLNIRELKARAAFSLLTFVNCGLFVLVTRIQPQSALYTGRMTISLPENMAELLKIVGQLKSVFLDSSVAILGRGFVRGVGIAWEDGALLYALIAVVVCICIYLFQNRDTTSKRRLWTGIGVALLLFIAPITPFFVLPNPWIGLRNAVIPFVGMILFFDIVFCAIVRSKKLQGVVAAIICVMFIMCGVSEISDYRSTYLSDARVIMAVAGVADGTREKIAVIGVESSFLKEQNFLYHEHIHGVTNSDWALTGAVNAYLGYQSKAKISPISSKSPYHVWDKPNKLLKNFDSVYYYKNGTITLLDVKNTGGDNYDLYVKGALFASLTDEDDLGVFTIHD